MKSKRGSNKIYYYIDLFFILLPILFYSFGFLICLFNYNNGCGGNYTISSTWFNSFITEYNGQVMDFIYFYIGDYEFENTIIGYCFNIIYSILEWFGISFNDYTIFSLINFYFTYLIFYEIFSLFINILMWLPRWCRNKVRDCSGSDSV